MKQLELDRERAEKEREHERAEKERERAEKERYRHELESKRPDPGVSPSPSELMTTVVEKSVQVWWDARQHVLKFPKVKRTEDSASAKQTKSVQYERDGMSTTETPTTFNEKTSEANVEAAFGPLFQRVFDEAQQKSGIWWYDGHKTFWLTSGAHGGDGLAPDAVASDIAVVDRPVAAHVLAIHDNKERRCTNKAPGGFTGFTNDDKGKLVRYLIRVLAHQPVRRVISGSLFDGKYAQCFRFYRHTNVLEAAPAMNCSQREEAQLFVAFLTDRKALSWDAAPVLQVCGELLGAGVTGSVYRHAALENCVVKVPRVGKASFTCDERQLLLEAAVKSDHFIQVHEKDDGKSEHLLLSPVCESVVRERWRLSPLFLLPLFEGSTSPLQQLHAKRFVHMDIRPENVLQSVKGEVVLVDGGAIRRMDEEAPFRHGTLFCASSRILIAVQSRAKFKVEAGDDLEAVVRCAFVMTQMSRPEYYDALARTDGDPDKIRHFWNAVKAENTLWAPVFRAADHGADRLVIKFRERFGEHSVAE